MADKINDGGPAFPNSVQPDFQWAESGMSLRDWFAGQALAGIMAHPDGPAGLAPKCAADAYQVAGAMLKAREAQQ